MPERITPRTLKGFVDYLPEMMLPRERLIEQSKSVYRSFGFSPIDTPVLEYLEILQGKGSDETDRQLYKFKDNGGRDVGMRFDLTVPLARFVSQHINALGTPFKRYHIAKVWRGEKPQHGRYREFMQCDFDTIGTLNVAADIETAMVIHELLHRVGFERFRIRINNRQVLNGLLDRLNLADKSTLVLRALDKLPKIGADAVVKEMQETADVSEPDAGQLLALADTSGGNDAILLRLAGLVEGNEQGESGVQRLRELLQCLEGSGVPMDRFQLDPSIARGLDYYTGVIFETFLDDLPEIGSVCSGGRYDNLAELFTKQQLPGIGASLGLDRLLTAMEKLGMVDKVATPAPVFIAFFDKEQLAAYQALARRIRAIGIGTEVYPDPKKLGQQLKYANSRGFRIAIVMGEQEVTSGVCQVKDLAAPKGEGNQEVSLEGNALETALLELVGDPSASDDLGNLRIPLR